MRSTFTRGTRRLLVTAGVMTLGLSAVAPATVWANGNGRGPDPADTGEVVDEAKTWICKPQGEVWELIHVNRSALPAQTALGAVEVAGTHVAALEAFAAEHEIDLTSPASMNKLGEDEEQGVDGLCEAVAGDPDGDGPGGEDGGDLGGEDDDDGGPGGEDGGDLGGDDEGPLGGNGPVGGEGAGAPVTTVDVPVHVPAGPVVVPGTEAPRQPLPVIISTDQVEAPVEVTPPAPVVEDEPEVMGVTTTRTPTPQVAGSTMQTLPRTGADRTVVLAAAGGALVLAGLALELASRRRQSVAGGQLPAA